MQRHSLRVTCGRRARMLLRPKVLERAQPEKFVRMLRECLGKNWRAMVDEDGHYCFAVAL